MNRDGADKTFLGLCVAVSVFLSGCSRPRPLDQVVLPADSSNDAPFKLARLYKPPVPGGGSLQARLAPLFLLEVDNDTAPVERMTVRCSTNTVSLNGQSHMQLWSSWDFAGDRQTSGQHWLCMILDRDGKPFLWLIPPHADETTRLYVSQSLEAVARRQFGPPLPGRRFSVERDVQGDPRAVVAGVVSDGPVAMGPIVHLRQETHEIATITCRCDTPQARELAGTVAYELVSVDRPEVSSDTSKRAMPGGSVLPDRFMTNDLSQILRFPAMH